MWSQTQGIKQNVNTTHDTDSRKLQQHTHTRAHTHTHTRMRAQTRVCAHTFPHTHTHTHTHTQMLIVCMCELRRGYTLFCCVTGWCSSIGGLVVEDIVAIDVTRNLFPCDALINCKQYQERQINTSEPQASTAQRLRTARICFNGTPDEGMGLWNREVGR